VSRAKRGLDPKRLLILLAACGGAATPVNAPSKPAPAPVDVAWDALEGPVKEVTVNAADATLVAKIQPLVAGVAGKPLDRAALREALSHAFALPGVGDIVARGVQRDDGIQLELDVTPQPTVHQVREDISDAGVQLPAHVQAATGQPLEPARLDAQAAQLRDQLVVAGYPDASVRWTTKPAGNEVDVVVTVAPGPRIVIDHVVLAGNAHAKAAELLKAMDLPPGPWNQERVDRATVNLNSYYYDHGYVNVSVEPPAPSATPTFTIQEGDQFRIGKLSIKDAKPADEKKWLALLGVKKGDVFSRAAMTAGVQKLQDATSSEVEPETKLDDKKKTIDIVFALQKSVSPTSK
jgi:outer membrane protein assembly factor BamA